MVAAVADTHAALWYLFGDARLSLRARECIDRAAQDRQCIAISPISLAEIVYLIEKSRISANALQDLREARANPSHVFMEAPFDGEVVGHLVRVSRDAVPDLPDRIIAATALYFDVPVVSRDGRIRASRLETVW